MAGWAAAAGTAVRPPRRAGTRPPAGVYTAGLMDLIMLTALGGRERTRDQLAALLGPCGYSLVRDTPMDRILPWRILEFQYKPN